jgi:hypothetical protein
VTFGVGSFLDVFWKLGVRANYKKKIPRTKKQKEIT